MYSHKHRKYVIDNRRNFAAHTQKCADQKNQEEQRPKSCPSKQVAGKKEKKGSFWQGMFGAGKKKEAGERPPIECCKLRRERGECQEDPDLSDFDGQPFRTPGSAYVIQKDNIAQRAHVSEAEDRILRKIEAPADFKDRTEDPMPPFESVEKRMLDLSQRRLHPFYKRLQTIHKKPPLAERAGAVYKSRSGPIAADDIPVQLKYNKELLEKKNMFADYKRVEPPQQLLAKMVEMKKNERPTLERRRRHPKLEKEKKLPKRQAVFETLVQDGKN